jgi:hypothetical protein
MYSEVKPNTAEKQELARRKLVQTLKDNPNLSMNGCWDKVKKENPQLFADLQAADWMADDEAEEREKEENQTHGSFKPSDQATHQFAQDIEEIYASYHYQQLQRSTYRPSPGERVECVARPTEDGGLIIQGAFSNPL